MTNSEILTAYLNILWNSFQWDIHYFSQPWLYYWLLVPFIFYLIFFFVKWMILTTPIWLPFRIILGGIFYIKYKNKTKE